MTNDEIDLILSTTNDAPGREYFLKHFRDGPSAVNLASALLVEALQARDSVSVECALNVGFMFGFTEHCVQPLIQLTFAGYHSRHEDVAEALGEVRSEEALPALLHLTEWIPTAVDDPYRNLAVKAIDSIGRIPGLMAEQQLKRLSHSCDVFVCKAARRRLELRRGGNVEERRDSS